MLGGVSICYLEAHGESPNTVEWLEPHLAKDLAQMSMADNIFAFVDESVLKVLYPATAKEALRTFCSSPAIPRILSRYRRITRVNRVEA